MASKYSRIASLFPDTNLAPEPTGILPEPEPVEQTGALKSYGKDVLKASKRAGGVAMGALFAMPAYAAGGLAAPFEDWQQFKKLPPHKQLAVTFGGASMSAWEAVTKEGSFGVMSGELIKRTTGKTINEHLPKNMRWAAPTIEVLGDMILDPFVSAATAMRVAGLHAVKEVKHISKAMSRDLAKLTSEQQAVAKEVLEKSLAHRSKVDAYKAQQAAKVARGKPMRRGEPKAEGQFEIYLPDEIANRRMKSSAPITSGQLAKGPLTKSAEESARVFGKAGETAEELYKSYNPNIPDSVQRSIRQSDLEKTVGKLEKKKTTPARLREVTQSAKRMLAEQQAKKAVKVGTGVKTADNIVTTPTTMHGFAGGGAGIEIDEEGNFVGFDHQKAAAGMLLGVGGLKMFNATKAKTLKTAMKNSPAWTKVYNSIGTQKKGFELVGLIPRIVKSQFDRFTVLKGKSPKAHTAAQTYHSYKDVAALKVGELKDALKPVADSEVEFTSYMLAHRNQTRAQRGLANPAPKGQKGVTLSEANEAIIDIEKHWIAQGKDINVLKAARDTFQEFTNKHILQEGVKSGLISPDKYKDIVRNNKWYATFDVLDMMPDDVHKIPMLKSAEYFSPANNKIIMKAKGTESMIADPIEATIKKFAEAQAAYAKNSVANALINDPAMKSFLQPVVTPKAYQTAKAKGLDPVLEGHKIKGKDTISRFKDGNLEKFMVDQEIADAMKQLTPWQAPKYLRGVNSIFRKSATTAYLPFTISNATRDALLAYTTAPVYKVHRPDQFARDWARGFWEGAKHEFLGSSKLAEEYIKSGGGFGYVGNLRDAKFAKSQLFKRKMVNAPKDIINSPIKLLEHISSTVELAPRLGTFRRAKMMGLESTDAALMARRSTIDFNRAGVHTKILNQFVPFLNARIQSRVTMANALRTDWRNFTAKAFAATTIPGAAAYFWNRLYHSDFYDDIPDYIRQNYFTIITGTHENDEGKITPQYTVIPKGDLGQLTWNPIEWAFDQMWEKDTQGTAEFAVNYLSDYLPFDITRDGKLSGYKTLSQVTPPIVKGVIEDFANLKFYSGRQIVPHYMKENKPQEYHYKKNTPENYKKMAMALKDVPLVPDIFKDPLRMQNFMSNVFAGYGREGLNVEPMALGFKGRIIKTTGGHINNRALKTIKVIEDGYITARATAEEAVKLGDRQTAFDIINAWDSGLNEMIKKYNKEFKKRGLQDKGGLRKSYSFSLAKRKNLFSSRDDDRTYLEKQLQRRPSRRRR